MKQLRTVAAISADYVHNGCPNVRRAAERYSIQNGCDRNSDYHGTGC